MRTHVDAGDPALVEEWSLESSLRCDPKEDKARQEFRDAADVNVILRKFGTAGFEPRPVRYGVQDMDADLQQHFEAARSLQEGWLRLPESLRRRYPSWDELLDAVQRGEASLVDPDGVEVEPPKVEAPVVPVAP